MKSLILTITFILPLFLFSQEKDPLFETHTSSFGLQLNYDHYNYKFTSSDYSNAINYSAGIAYKRRFKTRFEVKAMVAYSEKGYNYEEILNPEFPEFSQILDNRFSLGYIDFSIALGFRYMLNKKIVFVPGAGLVMGYMVRSAVYVDEEYDEFKTELYSEFFAKTVLGINIQLGIEFNLNKDWFILAEPYFREGLTNIDEIALESSPSSFGLGLGIFRKF